MATWDDIMAAWASSWTALYNEALTTLGPALQADVTGYLGKIQESMASLLYSRATLDQIKQKVGQLGQEPADAELRERYEILEIRYHTVAAGIYTDATCGADRCAALPLVAIAGITLGVAACAWAVAAYEYFANLRDQTALLDHDLDARIWAMKNNKTLPAPNLAAAPAGQPPGKPPDDEDPSSILGWLLLGGLALTAAALTLPALTKKG